VIVSALKTEGISDKLWPGVEGSRHLSVQFPATPSGGSRAQLV
jgi:hypothetical protein